MNSKNVSRKATRSALVAFGIILCPLAVMAFLLWASGSFVNYQFDMESSLKLVVTFFTYIVLAALVGLSIRMNIQLMKIISFVLVWLLFFYQVLIIIWPLIRAIPNVVIQTPAWMQLWPPFGKF
jgi:hypothetical protein